MDDFTALYRRYAPDVHRFALNLTRDRDEAADITSETFARAWAAPGPIRMETVKGYLFTIARNLFLQRLRKRRRRVELAEDLPDPAPDPSVRAEQTSEVDAVMTAVQRLPEIDRTALLLSAVDGMPYEEIARALGITVTAVKMRIYRVRAALLHLRRP